MSTLPRLALQATLSIVLIGIAISQTAASKDFEHRVLAAPSIQFAPPNQAGVTMGALYFSVRDVKANQKFWIALGATPVQTGEKQIVLKFPNVLVFLTKGEPLGSNNGSVLDHVGFQVPNVPQAFEKLTAAGYKMQPGDMKTVANVFTPEGERLELLEDGSENVRITFADGRTANGSATGPKMRVPILLHHVHLYVPEGSVPEVKAWYAKYFGGIPCKRWHYEAVDLPGVNIDISGVPQKLAASKGRILDHIGFEVKNLRVFCRKLQANGVTLDQPYTRQASGRATAYLTDPWGTYIELSEDLNHH